MHIRRGTAERLFSHYRHIPWARGEQCPGGGNASTPCWRNTRVERERKSCCCSRARRSPYSRTRPLSGTPIRPLTTATIPPPSATPPSLSHSEPNPTIPCFHGESWEGVCGEVPRKVCMYIDCMCFFSLFLLEQIRGPYRDPWQRPAPSLDSYGWQCSLPLQWWVWERRERWYSGPTGLPLFGSPSTTSRREFSLINSLMHKPLLKSLHHNPTAIQFHL